MSMLLDAENISKEPSTKSQNRPDVHHSKKVIIAHSKARPRNSERNTNTLWVIILHFTRGVCREDQNNKTQKAVMSLTSILWRTQRLKDKGIILSSLAILPCR